MKTTVCELPNELDAFDDAWRGLCEHTNDLKSEFVLLPEMPFCAWLADSDKVDPKRWDAAVEAHRKWVKRLPELGAEVVVGSQPAVVGGVRQNLGFVWDAKGGLTDAHAKVYLPNEPGFFEAEWFEPGEKKFESVLTRKGRIGFQICSELWFFEHGRAYGKQGVQLLVCPRATSHSTVDKWVAGGRAAAVVSGAYCLSSNHTWRGNDGRFLTGAGWIIDPEEGEVLGLTSTDEPFLTVDIDLSRADAAKETYPRYVKE